MASPTSVPSNTPIAQLNPNLTPDGVSITGIVTLIWPYATFKKTFSLLLVEPDFRLRSNRGQVRVHFQGSSAKAVARSEISSGDRLLLSLTGAQWAKDSTAATTPGRGIDCELQFRERLLLEIQRPSQRPISLDIDHPTPSPEPPVQTSTPARSPTHNNFATSIGRPQLEAQVWPSPAFLKRNHFLPTDYDPFAEDDFPDNDRRKRRKFGRGSDQWLFAERTPSPEKELETSPLKIVSPSGLTAQDKPRGEEVLPPFLEAHGIGPPSKASDVAMSILTDPSDQESRSEDDPTAKYTSVEEGKEPSTLLSQVNGSEHTEDENNRDSIEVTSRTPQVKAFLKDSAIPEERGDFDGSNTEPLNSNPEADHLDDEGPQKTAEITQDSAPTEIPSSASSSSAPEIDQESDKGSHQESADASRPESDSLLNEQFESVQSKAASFDSSVHGFGLDGSNSSRSLPTADFEPSPNIVNRLKEGPEVISVNTDDTRDGPSDFRSDVEEIENEVGKPLISKESVAESLLSDGEDHGENADMAGGHHAAQRLSSVQFAFSDQLRSPEAGEPDDETIKDPAAAQLLADDGHVEHVLDKSAAQRSSSNSPSSSDQSESRGLQDKPVPSSKGIPNAEAAPEVVPEKSPAVDPEEQLPPSSQEKEDLLGTLEEESMMEMSPEDGQAGSAVRQELSVTRQKATSLETELSREDSNAHGQDVRNRAESVVPLTSKAPQLNVEIIDLESDEESDTSHQTVGQKSLQPLVDQNDSKSAPTNEVSACETLLPLSSDTRNERRASTDEAHSLPTLSDSPVLVLQPAATNKESRPVDTYGELKAHEEALEPEEESSRKPSPVVEIQSQEEELPSTEKALFQQSQEARLESGERELPFEEEPSLKQLPIAETELKHMLIDELPSTVLDSFEDKRSKSQVLTPSSTQRTDFASQPSSLSLQAASEEDTLPTPRPTQGTSAGVVPSQSLALPEEPALAERPAPPKKTSALIEKLKEMRRLSNQNPKPRSSDASILDPWFAPKRLSQVVPDSEEESEPESSPEREAQAEIQQTVVKPLCQTPEKPLAKSFIRSPPPPKHISSIQSSPQYLPPSQHPPPGFRTKLSYFVPLATLPSHFATTVDILAIVLSNTPVTRATFGPRDYNQTLYVTDPSSSALQNSITTAQIFRPRNRCFPLVEKGDALLLRNFKVQPFQMHLSLLSTETSAWAVFHKGADVQIRGPPVEFGAEERGFARGLWDWWASLGDDARKRFENAVPDYGKSNSTAQIAKTRAGGDKSDAIIKKEEIEGLGVDLPGSQSKRREATKERSLGLDGVEGTDVVRESIEAPKRVLRARGAKGANGRSESARESRFGTVFTGGLGEPDATQGSAHELRDGKAYRDKSR